MAGRECASDRRCAQAGQLLKAMQWLVRTHAGTHARTTHTSTHLHTCEQTRTACAHFVQLCASEHQLFHSIFSAAARGGAGSAASSNYKDEESTGLRCDNRAAHGHASHTMGSVATHLPLPSLLSSLPSLPLSSPLFPSLPLSLAPCLTAHYRKMLVDLTLCLSDHLRPLVLQQVSVDCLSELVHILQHEVVEDQLRPRGNCSQPLHCNMSLCVYMCACVRV